MSEGVQPGPSVVGAQGRSRTPLPQKRRMPKRLGRGLPARALPLRLRAASRRGRPTATEAPPSKVPEQGAAREDEGAHQRGSLASRKAGLRAMVISSDRTLWPEAFELVDKAWSVLASSLPSGNEVA